MTRDTQPKGRPARRGAGPPGAGAPGRAGSPLAASPPKTLIVTGMHRSGTSFLTECLGQLGWALPADRGGPSPDNPRGHFEPGALVALNDDALAGLGAAWSRFSPLSGAEQRQLLDRGYCDSVDQALSASFGPAQRRVVKDPRIALLSPLWRDWRDGHAGDVSVIVAMRDPLEVAQSLEARDGLPPTLSCLCWVAHSLGALSLAAGASGIIVPFPQWTADPGSLADRLLRLTGTDPAVAAAFSHDVARIFRPDALHGHVAQSTRGRRADPRIDAPLLALAQDIAARALAWAGADILPAPAELAALAGRFSRVGRSAMAVEARAHVLVQSLGAARAEAESARVADQASLAAARSENARLAAECVAVADLLKATEDQRDIAMTQLQARMDDAALLRGMVSATERQRDDLDGLLSRRIADAENLERRVALTELQRDHALQAVDRLEGDLRHQSGLIAAGDAVSRDLGARLKSASSRAERLLIQNAGLRRERDAAMAEAQAQRSFAARLGRRSADMAAEVARLSRAHRLTADSLIDTAERLHAARAEARGDAERLAKMAADSDALQIALSAADARARTLSAALADMQAANDMLRHQLRTEQMTILRPIYRRIYRACGPFVRRRLTAAQSERLKRYLPHPDGIPDHLATVGAATDRTDPAAQAIAPRDPVADLPDIVILSIINWDFRTQRPQHLARDWARRGHRVFYVEMEPDAGDRQVRTLEPRLHVVRLGVPASDLIPTYRGMPDARQVREWAERLAAFCEAAGASPVIHVVIQHPFWWNFARALPRMYTLTFDCMDEISGFSNTEPPILAAEAEMARQADHVVVSSQYLFDKYAGARPVTLVRNAADVAHFLSDAVPRAGERFPVPGARSAAELRVGYVGAIAEWFDVEMVRTAAERAPDMAFHLCGAVTDPAALALRNLPNVTLHGEIRYDAVPGFLSAMDVMTIPFRLLPIIRACDPVKFYEYAAAGKPVVATHLPELERAGALVRRAADAEAFVAALRAAAKDGQDSTHVAALQAFARANTWTQRGAAFLDAILPEPRVSVIVLAYGDPGLTLTTVHSLVGTGRVHPALDIIVVDNGSPPDAVAALRDALSRVPGARLIENGRNLGFAGGNNVGIAAATGEYVLLLNNDTFVAPGSITAMVRHLQAHPRIGVVGPMTNNIGNEARIEVHYADMAEMKRAANAVTTGYRGQWTEIGVAAYFCAMFRTADLREFGPLDEAFGRGMFEDDDHCARIHARGFVCALAEDAFVHHHLSASFDRLGQEDKRALFERNRAIYEERWGTWTPHRYRDSRPKPLLGAA